jgi:uncharacterized protein
MEKRNFILTGVEVRAKDDATDETGKARGYAAVFNSASHDLGGFVEFIKPGAFARSLEEAGKGEHKIYALWAHRDDSPLASTGSGKLVLKEDERGLYFEMDTTRMTPAQLSALEDNDLQMSFGFSVREQEWIELADGKIERTLIDLDLFEVSFVISPAYPETEAALRSLEAWKASREVASTVDTTAMLKRVLTARVDLRLQK